MNGPGFHIELVSNEWLLKNVRTNHGPLGEKYPKWEYIMEGDTPSFMNLINNGLGSHVSPGFGGWGGRYVLKKTYADVGAIWQNSRDRVVTPDGKAHVSNTATIWRWRQAFQHDFAARMDWCVAESRDQANHNPMVTLNGDRTKNVIHIDVKAGQTIQLSGLGTRDPDGDSLTFKWFHYAEASRDLLNVRDLWSVDVANADTSTATIKVPAEMPNGTKDIHVILDVEDSGEPRLHAYRRAILHVES